MKRQMTTSILSVNLRALLLLLGVVLVTRIKFPFPVMVMLIIGVCVVITLMVHSAKEKLLAGVRKQADGVGIYGCGYEEKFSRDMVSGLLLTLAGLMVLGAGLFLIPEGVGHIGTIETLRMLFWPVLVVNVFHLIFWVVRTYLLQD